jgi:dipeptidyl aminopeptidase/acylaminoacyl peptidase
MFMKKWLFSLVVLNTLTLFAQDDFTFQTPPSAMTDLLLAKPTPNVIIDSKGQWMVLFQRNIYSTVEELAQPELRIAGLRINPLNFGPTRTGYFTSLQIKNIKTGETTDVNGLPTNLRGANLQWNQQEDAFAFINYTSTRIDLYLVTLAGKTAKKINSAAVNAVIGGSFFWVGNNSIIYKTIATSGKEAPSKPVAPSGPVVQESKGTVAPGRTFQDLIKNSYDEALFEYYATSQLIKTNFSKEEVVASPAIYSSISVSPNTEYLLTRTIDKPFSYLVPFNGFPHTFTVLDRKGATVKIVTKNPSSEGAPIGFDDIVSFPRAFSWRDDEPATITYIQALDKGLGKSKSEFRDAVFSVSAAGNEVPRELFKTRRRYRGIVWGNNNLALFYESMFAERKIRMNRFNPATGKVDSLNERSLNDEYNNIGEPITQKNQYGKETLLLLKNGHLLLSSDGAGPSGDMPLLQSWDITTGARKQLWRCADGYYETIVTVIDAEKGSFLTSRESSTLPANYFLRSWNNKKETTGIALTDFKNPYTQLEGITKQRIMYKRADGVDLTAQLYLPRGYDNKKDGALPVLIWAYPIEYKSKADAAQVRGSKFNFTRVSWGSPVFWVTQGYAVMDNTEMPIIGEGNKEPNDTYIPQLYLNAHAAIQAVAKMGVGDSNRVAVGGHSYGAFMTTNLLAHTKLFKAGIARSGAYNRTLTPFGFQSEERTYWQAPDIYHQMSPFSHADKIKTPLLLIHGDADNNSGTFPIQSERLFNAVKGHGGTVRYVSLPYESHGYNAKENLLHMLWEQNQWLEKYVKNGGKNETGEKKKSGF